MQIIPSIDIAGGKCVRLLRGDFRRMTVYPTGAADVARQFIDSGATAIHVVDLDGAKAGRVTNWNVIGEIGALSGAEVQVGGGVRSDVEIEGLLACGADRVVVGSAVLHADGMVNEWARKFGPGRFCVALDLRNGHLAYQGWQMESEEDVAGVVADVMQFGIVRFLSTDIRKDGTLGGPNVDLYRSLVTRFPQARWYASGGVGSVDDIRALKATGVAGVIVGKALMEGKVRLRDLLEAAC
ncbi:MAG TPA: 1-(5-phosphoribosyl)-5-[(5-phosphoribosylamino)methylideneamino]imidazole-4-carboxamide isomerase [Bacteroidota bacterium]|nr:1-(5-phosphoribosyl)-5-[(5-phosphoribosylamino)methylideneamino]imidazole-4-carboxamide isomerase [Bacteroidota bacterium]